MAFRVRERTVMEPRLTNLCQELAAIELWDDFYFRKASPGEADNVSYRARRERRHEITQEILKGYYSTTWVKASSRK
jgi:hypothetical protein